jgi:hypothetical protein
MTDSFKARVSALKACLMKLGVKCLCITAGDSYIITFVQKRARFLVCG